MKMVDYIIVFAILVTFYLIHNKQNVLVEAIKVNNTLVLKAKKIKELKSRYSNKSIINYLKQKSNSNIDMPNSKVYIFEKLDMNGLNDMLNKVLNSNLKLKSFEIIKTKKLAKLKIVVIK